MTSATLAETDADQLECLWEYLHTEYSGGNPFAPSDPSSLHSFDSQATAGILDPDYHDNLLPDHQYKLNHPHASFNQAGLSSPPTEPQVSANGSQHDASLLMLHTYIIFRRGTFLFRTLRGDRQMKAFPVRRGQMLLNRV